MCLRANSPKCVIVAVKGQEGGEAGQLEVQYAAGDMQRKGSSCQFRTRGLQLHGVFTPDARIDWCGHARGKTVRGANCKRTRVCCWESRRSVSDACTLLASVHVP